MRTIDATELKRILDLHTKWLLGLADGVRANLAGANLRGADLRGENLAGANLSGANLSWSNLIESDLIDVNLSWSNLTWSNLAGADLSGVDLTRANLTPIRDDIWAVLSASPAEVESLRAAIAEGRVDGSTYEGECACLVGTLANARHCDWEEIPNLTPSSDRPAERFFLGIHKGDTPETSQFSRLALEWVDEWLTNVRAAFGKGNT